MIVAEVTYGQKDYARAIRFMGRRQNRVFNMFLLLAAIVIVSWLYVRDPFGFSWWIVPAIIALLVLWYGLMRLIATWNVSRQLRNAPAAQGSHIWTIGSEGINIAGPISRGDLKWEAIIKVLESKHDFFFYTAPKFAQFLPKRSVSGDESLASLRKLITERMGQKAKVL